jgi:hypothetical protein
MALPNQHDSPLPFSKPCLNCKAEVKSEKHEWSDHNGKVYVWYSPASRYWNVEGVFCSPECGLIISKAKTT